MYSHLLLTAVYIEQQLFVVFVCACWCVLYDESAVCCLSSGCPRKNICTLFVFLLICANFGKMIFFNNYGVFLIYITYPIR